MNLSIIDKLFNDNPYLLTEHHLETYDEFLEHGIKRILKEKNPITILQDKDINSNEYNLQCQIYIGGKEGNLVYYGKPMIYDNQRQHFMYPNEARLRNMTYGVSIHYDIEIDFFINTADGILTETITLYKKLLGFFPIMLMSKICILKSLDPLARFEIGECKNDKGGYFIIDGKEKCIVSQEKFADNMLYVRDKVNEYYSHSAELRCVSEDASKPMRKVSVKIVSESSTYKNGQIVVEVPNVRKPVPLFILMRALGVLSDKEIIEYCLLDIKDNKYFVDLFIPSIHDANRIFNQTLALKYIASFTKGKTIQHVLEILSDYFLPNIGETNFIDKAFYTGYMVNELLKVYTKQTKPTDRDNFKFKRVELPGQLLYDLFKEYYSLQQKYIFTKFDKEFFYKQSIYLNDFKPLILMNQHFFSERIVEKGFMKAFKGNWGSQANTKRVGIVQDLNRLTFNSALSHLRKLNLPLDVSAKVIGPRLLHSSQWGIIDPVDTPDGGNVGLHKHLAISAKITTGHSAVSLIQWLRVNLNLKYLVETQPVFIHRMCKIFVNGKWIGVISDPIISIEKLKLYRRNALIPIYTSISWDVKNNIIYIFCDSGRLCRPVFYIENDISSINRESISEIIKTNNYSWQSLICGFASKKVPLTHTNVFMNVSDLYNTNDIRELQETKAIIEYLDSAETETSLIAMDENIETNKYTHMEIHPSLMFGIMGNQVVFPENNQLPRDLFACGQMRQAVSLYHSNYQNRIDKMGVILNNGQIPLVKSRYLEKINNEEHPYGENVIVAIMCYGGYNVEDSILFNEASVKRGLFRTTYFNMYEDYEERVSVGNSEIDTKFVNVNEEDVVGLKPGYDYGNLDENGLIKENTFLDDKKVIIGKAIYEQDQKLDSSSFPKKGQTGYVDKAFITEDDEGYRIAKVRVRDERIPTIGDKFCSRCGQKGTIGTLISEENMPFTENGIRPDIIVNPHAFPSRMTIGQLVESLMGKACALYGGFGDCTAFVNSGSKHEEFGSMLIRYGYHSSGCEVLYNGESGEQIDANIYIGPTYYMRLKHMVKDKINYRARGPRTALTRQTVAGRANDGGLRIGEMERDGILAHGATRFLQESMLIRGDEYFMAICNITGMIAIYNDTKNIFMSPYADGPIKFKGDITNEYKTLIKKTEFGRSFSIVRVPYAFKLLIHELQTMNIQMRVITEDNVDQLSEKSNYIFNLPEKTESTLDIGGGLTETDTIEDLEYEEQNLSNNNSIKPLQENYENTDVQEIDLDAITKTQGTDIQEIDIHTITSTKQPDIQELDLDTIKSTKQSDIQELDLDTLNSKKQIDLDTNIVAQQDVPLVEQNFEDVKPLNQQVDKSLSLPLTSSASHSVTAQLSEQVSEPVSEQVSGPVSDLVSVPVSEKVSEPVTNNEIKPIDINLSTHEKENESTILTKNISFDLDKVKLNDSQQNTAQSKEELNNIKLDIQTIDDNDITEKQNISILTDVLEKSKETELNNEKDSDKKKIKIDIK
tara:strand:+ start:5336 stop:9838 length:4503 start_codon:yes stop_codon:yes gene_type:complete